MNDELKKILDKEQEFKEELSRIINKYSKENLSDTPDFILAEYLYWCLANFSKAVRARTEWYKP